MPRGTVRRVAEAAGFRSVRGFNDHPDYELRTEDPQAGTPDGPVLHSILVDPRDAAHQCGEGLVRPVHRAPVAVAEGPQVARGERAEDVRAVCTELAGELESDVMPLATTIADMELLDEIRRRVGVVYPGET